MTFIKKFESIQKKISAFDASKAEEKIAMQVNMVDEDCGGAFYIEIADGALKIEPYDYNDRTVMITLKAADMVALTDKKASLEELVASGDVTVEGNFDHAKAVFELKKPAAKRTRKTPAKKDEAPAVKEEKKAAPKTKKIDSKAEEKSAPKAEKVEKKPAKKTTKK